MSYSIRFTDILGKKLMALPHGKSGNGSWTQCNVGLSQEWSHWTLFIEEGKPASEKGESTSFLPKPDLDAPPSQRENP